MQMRMTKLRAEENDKRDQYYGEPVKYDPTFNGPIANRSCTDVICCVLFCICFFGMLAVATYAMYVGEPERLIYPSNSDGEICGRGKHEKERYLLFFDLTECLRQGATVVFSGCPTPQVCVEHCPPSLWVWFTQHYKEMLDSTNIMERKHMYCKPGVNPFDARKSVEDLVNEDKCAPYLLPSRPVMGRCLPSKLPKALDHMVDRFNESISKEVIIKGSHYIAFLIRAQDVGLKIVQDIHASWKLCVILLSTAMSICLTWITLMRWIAGYLVWTACVLFVLAFCIAAGISLAKYFHMKDNPDHQLQGPLMLTKDMSYYWNLAYTWLTIGIICLVIVAVIVLLLIFLRKHLNMAILIIKEASRAVGMMKFTLLWPLIPFVLQLSMLFFWGVCAIYLASSSPYGQGSSNGTANNSSQARIMMHGLAEGLPCDPEANNTEGEVCTFLKHGGDRYSKYLQLYQFFMLFWVMNFIEALGQVTLAGAFASYYWAFTKPYDVPSHYLSAAFYRAIRYHMGSIAFGALVIAIVQLFQVILQYMQKKLKSHGNPVTIFILKCLKCCFWCLEKFVKFLSKNAYIMIAVYGNNFITSAKSAFNLLMRNVVSVAVIDRVTDVLLLISKLFVVGLLGLMSFAVFGDASMRLVPSGRLYDYLDKVKPELHFYWVPIVIVVLGTLVIATGFFHVYSMGVDTIFLSFLEDLERHDGSVEKPYYMNSKLRRLMNKKNRR